MKDKLFKTYFIADFVAYRSLRVKTFHVAVARHCTGALDRILLDFWLRHISKAPLDCGSEGEQREIICVHASARSHTAAVLHRRRYCCLKQNRLKVSFGFKMAQRTSGAWRVGFRVSGGYRCPRALYHALSAVGPQRVFCWVFFPACTDQRCNFSNWAPYWFQKRERDKRMLISFWLSFSDIFLCTVVYLPVFHHSYSSFHIVQSK